MHELTRLPNKTTPSLHFAAVISALICMRALAAIVLMSSAFAVMSSWKLMTVQKYKDSKQLGTVIQVLKALLLLELMKGIPPEA